MCSLQQRNQSFTNSITHVGIHCNNISWGTSHRHLVSSVGFCLALKQICSIRSILELAQQRYSKGTDSDDNKYMRKLYLG